MISRSDKGFLAAHWDWLVAILGVLALAGGVAVKCLPSDESRAFGGGVAARGGKGVAEVDLKPYEEQVGRFAEPDKITEPAEASDSFLASGRRVFCEQGDPASDKKACGRPIPFGVKVCPYADCGVKQPEEIKVAVDTDGDGMFDEWEKKYGLNASDPADADADADADGFTNFEEMEAGTDPTDPASHPDYLDSLKLALPLNQTMLPFYFEKVMPLPDGKHRFYFKDPQMKNDYGTKGKVYTPRTGEEIGKTGFVVKSYEHKTVERQIAGDKKNQNMTRRVDVSTATIERKSDRKTIVLVVGERNKPIDIQAKLVYERGETKEFLVVKGDTVELNGAKYVVQDILHEGKRVAVVIGSELGKKTLEALEQ